MNGDSRSERRKKIRRTVYSSKDLYEAITSQKHSKIFEILQQRNIKLRTIYKNDNRDTVLHLIFNSLEEEYVMQILEKFLDQDFDLALANKRGETVLYLAVGKRMKRAVDFLLNRNAEIFIPNEAGDFITHYFICNESKRFYKSPFSYSYVYRPKDILEKEGASYVEWLISKGFDFNYENPSGLSALDLAIKYDLQYILPILLRHTAKIDVVNKKNNRSLLHAFLEAQNEYRNKSSRFFHPLPDFWTDAFTQRYDIEIVNILLDNKVPVDSVDKYGDTALHIALRKAVKIDIMKMLLDRFTNVHYEDRGRTLLYDVVRCASEVYTHDEFYAYIMNDLISKGVTVQDADCPKIMIHAINSRSLRIIKLLKNLGVDFSMTLRNGRNSLHYLASYNTYLEVHIEQVQSVEAIFDWLVSEGCDVNAVDVLGESPLHLAVYSYNGNITAVRKLLAHGADVNCREKQSNATPLNLVGRADVAELLLNNGADVNSKSARDRRPIHQAVFYDNNDALEVILERGAYVDVPFENGAYTALSYCVQQNCWSCVEELLKYGADVNHQTVTRIVEHLEDLEGHIQRNDAWMKYCLPHWVKLKAAKLLLFNHLDYLVPNKYYEEFSKKLENEIERLKSTQIDSFTSLYGLLHMDINNRCMHINNENLVYLMESDLFEKQFPNYYILILASYREAVARKSLLEPAKEAWYDLTKIYLPDICVECIFGYLSNPDLVIMIERDG